MFHPRHQDASFTLKSSAFFFTFKKINPFSSYLKIFWLNIIGALDKCKTLRVVLLMPRYDHQAKDQGVLGV